MNIVPRVSTPKSLEEIAAELREAFAAETGRPLDATTGALLTAQILAETANGASVKNNSPANISASKSWPGDAWRPPWFEVNAESGPRMLLLHEQMLRGQAPSAFRAFASWSQGMRDYVGTLQRQFPTILAARTPRELAHAIFDSGYTRDHTPEATEPTFTALVDRVRKSGVFDDLAPEPTTRPDLPKVGAAARSPSGSLPALSSYRYVTPPDLTRGDSGPLVVFWQRVVGVVDDGLFGQKTEDATRAWQAKHGLPVTGVVSVTAWTIGAVGQKVWVSWRNE